MCQQKLLVLFTHKGRGSNYYGIQIYTEQTFVGTSAKKKPIWEDEHLLEQYCNKFDYKIFMGIIHVSPEDHWLVLFDADSAAIHEYILVKDHEDIDTIVKKQCMEAKDEEEIENLQGCRSGYIQSHSQYIKYVPEAVWKVPNEKTPLDWTAHTNYNCIKHHYSSAYWSWADGHDDFEPYLIDYSENIRGYGIMRVDLHTMNLNPTIMVQNDSLDEEEDTSEEDDVSEEEDDVSEEEDDVSEEEDVSK
jgi:hypothetical protein